MTDINHISLSDIVNEKDLEKLKTISIHLFGEYLRTLGRFRDTNKWIAEKVIK